MMILRSDSTLLQRLSNAFRGRKTLTENFRAHRDQKMDKQFDNLLAKVKTSPIVDAVEDLYGHRSHILDLVSPNPGAVLFGQAITIDFIPYRADIHDGVANNFAKLFYDAIGDNAEGKVLVLSCNGYTNITVGGGTKLSRLHNHKLAGLLTDALLRDFDELAEFDFVTYAGGETTAKSAKILMPHAVNVPVVVAGVTVIPGDYVYADASGAVIIPGDDVGKILEDAVRHENADAELIMKIKNEDPAHVLAHGSKK